MSESRKYVVPEGMLKAACRSARTEGTGGACEYDIRIVIEAALRWLSENPIVPTSEQSKKLALDWCGIDGPDGTCLEATWFAVEWQRRMFLAPEPEIPEEVKDLLDPQDQFNNGWPNHNIIEAFNRGRRLGERDE